MKLSNEEIIKECIEQIRPFLNMDGGDIEFIKYDQEEKIVYVRMHGACAACLGQDEDLEVGLLGAIQDVVSEVKKIINTPL